MCICHQKGRKGQSFFAAGISRPESPAPGFSLSVPKCGAALDSHRRFPGSSTESPEFRSLRPQDTGVYALSASSLSRLKCGALLDSCPEVPRRVPEVSGRTGVSGLWTPESPVKPGVSKLPELDGVSGLHRSLRPTYPGVSGLASVQHLDFCEGYKYRSPTLEGAARPAFMNPNFSKLK